MGAPYIYDISSLRVNDLNLILLTWRNWWAANNASKQQMGFNSAFKGLISSYCHHDTSSMFSQQKILFGIVLILLILSRWK